MATNELDLAEAFTAKEQPAKKPKFRPDLISGVTSGMFEPRGPYYLIERDELPAVTKIGTNATLHMPDTNREAPRWGTIIAAGDGWWLPDGTIKPLRYKVGERVIFSRHAGEEMPLEDGLFLSMREEDIRGRIK